ncbi:ferredoxin-thioredoxin reductase catalytic domain-containing protein [Dehalococcoides mccartyi]|jgi:ferredoxin-thioredoxin reductase catalytic subunit/rubredoxin|uniref:ferredoxin:thioredoxin reductase n=2 Tax=Dehalococcoides mccartyi TaxID=61435 RepID=A0A142V9L7_9CHLR|nr:ferredoxin-thioredoxin reductase catalytic domain-containing protein [Dehalococcoides mccartyi]AII60397.1 rubredoxin-type Fe(Cys)4 protein [Dehalococcoides mccartyi CG5]AMU86037.1 rubredoxin-type iron-sulfur protein [Dehalococcoides mccartyi]AOV98846.1 rubredoxin [Dehalococcoides mccartyi]MBA2084605.1 Rubredoxin [Dehalococcoides mccartyi]QBX63384.1 ferredoxin:glutaredoxin reductase [Dehalococcoides mccartyi]
MSSKLPEPSEGPVLFQARLKNEAEASGYHLNPDGSFVKMLAEGLLANRQRYGYPSCPCRLAKGDKKADLDIICPCDYRDADLSEFGSCYCALYVNSHIAKGEKKAQAVPERRHLPETRPETKPAEAPSGLAYPVWRCRACGYLCGRDEAPDECPICKADKERFERFM